MDRWNLPSSEIARQIDLEAENKKLKAAIGKHRFIIIRLLFSYNRHWIKMSLGRCVGTSPSEIAKSIVDAEQILEGATDGKDKLAEKS